MQYLWDGKALTRIAIAQTPHNHVELALDHTCAGGKLGNKMRTDLPLQNDDHTCAGGKFGNTK